MLRKGIVTALALSIGLTLPAYAEPSMDAGSSKDAPEIRFIVQTSPTSAAETTLQIRSGQVVRAILKAKPSDSPSPAQLLEDVRLCIRTAAGEQIYAVSTDGDLVDPTGAKRLQLPAQTRRLVLRYSESLRSVHYGQLVPWKEANKLAPKLTRFSVVDLETGLRFRVQRRAGSNHMDVQPLSKQDTAIMKTIYGGTWSWSRRAILVETEKGYAAASMHGMPHGGDGIPDNGFNGHFCIHFFGSLTHGTGNWDLAHQAMTFKAAGRLNDLLRTLTPYQLVDLCLLAGHQKDRHLLERALAIREDAGNPSFDLTQGIASVRRISDWNETDASGLLELKLPVTVRLQREGSAAVTRTLVFSLSRGSENEAWKVVHIADF